jgi:hypothetical protein
VIRDYLKVLGTATAGADDADLVARFARRGTRPRSSYSCANVFMVGWMDGTAAALKPDPKDDALKKRIPKK